MSSTPVRDEAAPAPLGNELRRVMTHYDLNAASLQQRLVNLVILIAICVPISCFFIYVRGAAAALGVAIEHLMGKR